MKEDVIAIDTEGKWGEIYGLTDDVSLSRASLALCCRYRDGASASSTPPFKPLICPESAQYLNIYFSYSANTCYPSSEMFFCTCLYASHGGDISLHRQRYPNSKPGAHRQ